MRIGIAADHGGFNLKTQLMVALSATGYEVADFGAQDRARIKLLLARVHEMLEAESALCAGKDMAN